MNIDKLKKLGEVIEWKHFIIFFGDKRADLEKIGEATGKEVSVLKQVHGTQLIKSTSGEDVYEADAQWASHKSPLPMIKTADCLPVMIADPVSKSSLCIHAGWKGVKDGIVPLSVETINFSQPAELKVWIGPHIQFDSFEVERDVADEILKDMNRDEGLVKKSADKFYINLSEIVIRQLISKGIMRSQISVSCTDTKTDENFYSYRRKDSGRNYSFCINAPE